MGDRSVADALLELPFDHILFTGSASVGRKVMAAAARNLTPVTLELGGKSPALVDETADLEVAAERIGWAKFINAGQTCVAPDYVLVHESVAPRFEVALRAVIERFYGAGEAARLHSPDHASLVDGASAIRLERAVKETLARGARVVVGGQVDAAARRMAPTVLSGVLDDSAIMDDEIFGPVLPLLTYRDLGRGHPAGPGAGTSRWPSTSSASRTGRWRRCSAPPAPAAPASTTPCSTSPTRTCHSAAWARAAWGTTMAAGASRPCLIPGPCFTRASGPTSRSSTRLTRPTWLGILALFRMVVG